jgi:hypothetical protein
MDVVAGIASDTDVATNICDATLVDLSLEILTSSFAGWSAIYPEAGSTAHSILRRNSRSSQMPLMEFYLYPPKYLSSAAVATLIPPPSRQSSEAESYRAPEPDLTISLG